MCKRVDILALSNCFTLLFSFPLKEVILQENSMTFLALVDFLLFRLGSAKNAEVRFACVFSILYFCVIMSIF